MKRIFSPACVFAILVNSLLLLCLVSPPLIHAKSFKIAMFYPRDDPFWTKAVFFAKEAAADLGVELETEKTDIQNRWTHVRFERQVG